MIFRAVKGRVRYFGGDFAEQRARQVNYFFDDFVLDPERRELRRGANLIAAEPQVFDLLQYLIRHRERVVSKDDLLAAIWHGRIISKSALTTRINSARAAIGDSGDSQRLIKTLRGKGFRFVGTVREEEHSAATSPAIGSIDPSRPHPSLSEQPSIAVLPFMNMSRDPEQDYFADGMTEEIITALARFKNLFVIASNSSLTYRSRSVDIKQIARELGVRYVLEGSVRKAADRVRITGQLIVAETGRHIWTERFDRQLEDIFDLQDEIPENIVGAVEPEILSAELNRSNWASKGLGTILHLNCRRVAAARWARTMKMKSGDGSGARAGLRNYGDEAVATIIKPSEVPKYVPGAVTAASDDLGWNGVWLRGYRYTGLDVVVPPVSDFTIISYRRGATFMERRYEGAWTKTHCAPGDVSLLTRSQRSHWHWTEEIDVSHVYLTENLVSRVCAEVTDRCVADVQLRDVLKSHDPIVTAAVAAITREAQEQPLGSGLYVEAVATQLAVHLLRTYAAVTFREPSGKGRLSPAQVRRLTGYIDSRLQEQLHLETLAAVAGMGVWTFARHFRESFGRTPHAYVIERRIDRARRLLAQSRLPIKEVASVCGFADQAHMTRVFQTHLRTTPAVLRL